MTPHVSVLMAVYNGERFIHTAIDSVLTQTMGNVELIISDNYSTDATPTIVQHYASRDSRVRVVHPIAHCTAVENFNVCYRYAHPDSPYVALLAADDWWMPSFLARCIAVADAHPTVAYVHSNAYRTRENANIINTYSDQYRLLPPPNIVYHALHEIFVSNFINTMATLVNRRVMATLFLPDYPTDDMFDATLPFTPDFNLWLQLIIRGGNGYYIDEPLAYYRKHDAVMTQPANIVPRLQNEITVLRQKIAAVCHNDNTLLALQRTALQQRLAQLGFVLLDNKQPIAAKNHLRESLVLSNWQRRDATIASIIATLPCSPACRRSLWHTIVAIAHILRQTA